MSKDKEIDQVSGLEKLGNKSITKSVANLNKQRLEILGIIKRPKSGLKFFKQKSRLITPIAIDHIFAAKIFMI